MECEFYKSDGERERWFWLRKKSQAINATSSTDKTTDCTIDDTYFFSNWNVSFFQFLEPTGNNQF